MTRNEALWLLILLVVVKCGSDESEMLSSVIVIVVCLSGIVTVLALIEWFWQETWKLVPHLAILSATGEFASRAVSKLVRAACMLLVLGTFFLLLSG